VEALHPECTLGRYLRERNEMPTALDNGLRSPRKLLRNVVARLLAVLPRPKSDERSGTRGGGRSSAPPGTRRGTLGREPHARPQTRAAAETIMRQLPVVQFDGLRKVYVRRGDVAKLLEERTFTKNQVAA
jgi:hypothetical protein